jgi:hypothetical protein
MKTLVTLTIAVLSLIFSSSSLALQGTWGNSFYRVSTIVDTPQPPDGHFANNYTGCPWKDEDEIMQTYSGDLSGTIVGNICLVADLDNAPGSNSAYAKLILGRIYAPKTANLSVWLTNDFGARWDATVIPYGTKKIYQFCAEDSVADNANIYFPSGLTYWPMIPGSNGYGQIVNYTIHVQNLGGKTVKGSYGYFDIANNGSNGTQSQPQIQYTAPSLIPCPSQDT